MNKLPLSRLIASWLLVLVLGLTGCAAPQLPLALAPSATPTALPTASATPAPTATPTIIPSPTITPTPSPIPSPTATFEPLDPTATLVPVGNEVRLEVFERAWTLVRDRYVYEDFRGIDWAAVREEFEPRVTAAADAQEFYELMREMINRLGDEHSRFESPQEVAAGEARFSGTLTYGGIGAIVRDVEEGGLIVTLAREGPAAEAGLQPRDLILAVSGVPFNDPEAFGPEGPISWIRGEPGTAVVLTVRSPQGEAREVSVVRRVIPSNAFPNVEVERLPGAAIGVVRITTFYADGIDTAVRSSIEQLLQEGPLDGLIVDVRDNSGGRVDLMLNTLGLFVDGGSIGSSGGRAVTSELNIPADMAIAALADIPIVVLISDETVSAAEMFAAGIQLTGRAQLVGTPTAGNTENLYPYNFDDGSRLWLAELAYRLPDGSLIEGSGVQPDRAVAAEWWRFAAPDDPQIRAALEVLGRA